MDTGQWERAFDIVNSGWFGSLTGLVGLVLAFVFYVRSLARTAIAFQHDTVHLVGGRGAAFPQEVEVRFEGKAVPHVAVSRVVLWNDGTRTISSSDLVTSDPLRLQIPRDGHVLKFSVVRETRRVNQVSLATGGHPNEVTIDFEFLDPRDGATIEVLHSGETKAVELHGTVRGGRDCIRNFGRAIWYSSPKTQRRPFPFNQPRLVFAAAVVVGTFITAQGLFTPQLAAAFPNTFGSGDPGRYDRISWPMVFAGIVYASIPAIFMWLRRRRYPSELEYQEKSKKP